MIRAELLVFESSELTLHNTSGLFSHHMWGVIQRGISLQEEEDRKLKSLLRDVVFIWFYFY